MREQIYKKYEYEGNELNDPMTCDLSEFKWTNGYYKHQISSIERMKPYLISLAYYGTIDYEDIILLLNNIPDIFEVVVSTEIKIPKLEDLKQFILENSK